MKLNLNCDMGEQYWRRAIARAVRDFDPELVIPDA
jgi:lactam utilization protein B